MSKHETNKTQSEEKENIKNQETNREDSNKKESKVESQKEQVEIEKLSKEIQQLKTEIDSKNERILQLEQEVKTINEDYVIRVTEKANEANALLKSKLAELSDKMQQDLAVHKKYALEKQAASLIDIINQFAMALSYKPTDPNIAKYQSGFQMFLTMFHNLLNELGITEIKVNVGDEFNPEIMECIEFVHSHELANNKVAKVITKGYKLYDRLIKPTVVNVVRKKS
jgi:molecular chaperone GrpE